SPWHYDARPTTRSHCLICDNLRSSATRGGRLSSRFRQLRRSRARPMLKSGKHAAAHRAAGQPHGGWLAYPSGGHAMSIAPTLHRYLAAENIQYAEISHDPTMSSTRAAQACHVSGDRLAKAVVLRHDGGYMLAVVPASHHLNLP